MSVLKSIGGVVKVIGAIFILIVIAVAIFDGGDDSDSDSNAASAASGGRDDVVLMKKKSACIASGVDDVYTGDGHVVFVLALKNRGSDDAEVDVTPIRYYSDGEENRSPLDTVTVTVPAFGRWRGRTEAMTYEAHAHEIVSCALQVENRPEIDISLIR